MNLGDLRAGETINAAALARALGLSLVALRALENTPLHRVSAGALASYVNAFGARVEILFADGQRLEVKP